MRSLSQEEQDRAVDELRVLRDLASRAHRTRADVQAASRSLNLHPSTIYRKLRALLGRAGTISDLLGAKRGYPKGVPRLHPRQVEIIDHWLKTHYLQPSKPPLSETTRLAGDQCEAEGFSRPTRAAVIRRKNLIAARTVARRRNGVAAEHRATPHPGRLEVALPWEMYQIDHTLTDVIVVDSEHLKPIGRAWLRVAIDVCTRMVVAFWVGLDPPSILRTGAVIDLAVTDKRDWLRMHGFSYEWPARGLCKVVHTDNGSDFRAEVIQSALRQQGVRPKFRRIRRPHLGAHVERLIGTFMGKCRMLPGATQNSPKARGDYDSAGSARVLVSELHAWFAHEILGNYHTHGHEGLGGEAPLEAWKRLTDGREPLMPDDPDRFRIELLPELTRTITAQGIKCFTEEYASPELLAHFHPGRRVRVKYDPRDLRQIFVLLPDGWLSVGLRFPNRSPVSLWLRAQGLRSVPHERKRDRTTVRAAMEAQRLLIEQGAARKATMRRQAERYRHEQEGAAALRERLSRRTSSEAIRDDDDGDDDWGGLA
jgi:putative transposase